jgi:DNA-binding CsgD family transcriptional regulator
MRGEAAARLDAVVAHAGGEPSHAERMMLAEIASESVFAGHDRTRAIELARRALGDGALLELETSGGATWITALAALGWADELDEFEQGLLAGLADAQRRGSVLAFATCSYALNFARYYSGRLADAVADARQALDAERYGWRQYATACRAQLAWAEVERDRLDAADEAIAPVAEASDEPAYSLVLDARARIALARGEPERALALALAAGEAAVAAHIPNPAVIPWAGHAAEAASRLGRSDQAAALAARELDASRRFGAPRSVGMALRVGGIAGGDIGLLRAAVVELERSPAKLELARALIDLGAMQRAHGDDGGAREPLRTGLDMAHRFGAAALERRARDELIASGARPRSAVITGVDALTPGERRTAAMAAAGLSNREIAQELFVTVKAVQWHLRNVYRKLGIGGRAELADALGGDHPRV